MADGMILEKVSDRSHVVQGAIYLDYQASTPTDPRVADVVHRAMLEEFGNANSVEHAFGLAAAEVIQRSSVHVAALVGAEPDDVYFTSGSSEAIRLVLAHASHLHRAPLRVGLSVVEHKAVRDAVAAYVRHAGAIVRWIDVDEKARLLPESLAHALGQGVDLICSMAANNEVGTIYPIQDIATQVHAAGALLLVDATQAAGHIELCVADWDIDYLVFNAHKIYGPKGIGAIIAPRIDFRGDLAATITPLSGTPNTPGIAGFGEACRLRRLEMSQDEARIGELRDHLELLLKRAIPDMIVNGDRTCRLAPNLHATILGAPSDAVITRLSNTVAISSGAACSSGAIEASHVLEAMRLSNEAKETSLRISLGKFTTRADVERAATLIASAISDVRSISHTRVKNGT
jgi:cysteine desulfurase